MDCTLDESGIVTMRELVAGTVSATDAFVTRKVAGCTRINNCSTLDVSLGEIYYTYEVKYVKRDMLGIVGDVWIRLDIFRIAILESLRLP